MKKVHPHDPCLFVFEKGDTDQGQLEPFLNFLKLNLSADPIFLEKKKVDERGNKWFSAALQTCDFIAYEHAKHLTDYVTRGRRVGRESLFSLMQCTDVVGKKYSTLGEPFF